MVNSNYSIQKNGGFLTSSKLKKWKCISIHWLDLEIPEEKCSPTRSQDINLAKQLIFFWIDQNYLCCNTYSQIQCPTVAEESANFPLWLLFLGTTPTPKLVVDMEKFGVIQFKLKNKEIGDDDNEC